jgi:tetratricopeptide (TPR) repeat protein
MVRPMRTIVLTAALVLVAPVRAQDNDRVNQILMHAEIRASNEADAAFELGDYPTIIQNQKIRFELSPSDFDLATNLVWMLGNIENDGESLAYAKRYRILNPGSPDKGFAEAELYTRWKMYSRIPAVLEPDIKMVPPPHRNSFTMLSQAYIRMKMWEDAVRVLDVAIKHYPDELVFVRNRARALDAIGG